eukprot:777744-Rhodomonas_salina.1
MSVGELTRCASAHTYLTRSAPRFLNIATKRGLYSSLTELCPSCPLAPFPQVQTSPVAVMATLWCEPQLTVSTIELWMEAIMRGDL